MESLILAIYKKDINEVKKLIHSHTENYKDKILLEIYNKIFLSPRSLQFLIENCPEYINITSAFLKILIKDNNIELLSIIFKNFEYYDTEFIITLLSHYKNQTAISTADLNQRISKCKIKINSNNPSKKYFITEILNKACADGKEGIVKYFTRLGAKINKHNKMGETPLFYACKNGNVNLVKFLIFTSKYKNSTSKTPAFFVCKNEKIIKTRISKESKEGETPLSYACKNGNETVVKYLIELGANIHKEYKHKRANFHEEDKSGGTLLHMVCDRGYLNLVKYLIEQGADINKRIVYNGWYNVSPLYISCRSGHEDIVKYLIEHGANINNGEDHLFIDYKNGNENIAKCLVEHGANINKENRYGETPLFFACMKGNEAIVKYLIEYGANIHKENENGETPLFYACNNGNENIIKYLVELGADTNKKNKYGESPLTLVQNCYSIRKRNIIQYLKEHGALD